MGHAAKLCLEDMEFDNEHITRLSNKLYDYLTKNIKDIYLNGDRNQRYPGNLNISFAYVEGESLIMAVKQIAVSSG
jgi:cysteine desulfurase